MGDTEFVQNLDDSQTMSLIDQGLGFSQTIILAKQGWEFPTFDSQAYNWENIEFRIRGRTYADSPEGLNLEQTVRQRLTQNGRDVAYGYYAIGQRAQGLFNDKFGSWQNKTGVNFTSTSSGSTMDWAVALIALDLKDELTVNVSGETGNMFSPALLGSGSIAFVGGDPLRDVVTIRQNYSNGASGAAAYNAQTGGTTARNVTLDLYTTDALGAKSSVFTGNNARVREFSQNALTQLGGMNLTHTLFYLNGNLKVAGDVVFSGDNGIGQGNNGITGQGTVEITGLTSGTGTLDFGSNTATLSGGLNGTGETRISASGLTVSGDTSFERLVLAIINGGTATFSRFEDLSNGENLLLNNGNLVYENGLSLGGSSILNSQNGTTLNVHNSTLTLTGSARLTGGAAVTAANASLSGNSAFSASSLNS